MPTLTQSDPLAEAKDLFGPALESDEAEQRTMPAPLQLLWLIAAFAAVGAVAGLWIYVVLRFIADHGLEIFMVWTSLPMGPR